VLVQPRVVLYCMNVYIISCISHISIRNLDTGTGTRQEGRENKYIQRPEENFDKIRSKNNETGTHIDAGGASNKIQAQLLPEGIGGNSAPNSDADHIPPLVAGERVEGMYKDMTYLCPYSLPCAVKGSMVLTNYRIYFKSDVYDISTSSSGSPLQAPPLVLDVPLGFVSNVIKIGGQNRPGDEHAYGLEIVCKDIRTLKFAMSKKYQDDTAYTSNPKGSSSRSDMYGTIRRFSFPNTHHIPMFAYEFGEDYPQLDYNGISVTSGWKIYDAAQVNIIFAQNYHISKPRASTYNTFTEPNSQ
jgi:hypothetical protein